MTCYEHKEIRRHKYRSLGLPFPPLSGNARTISLSGPSPGYLGKKARLGRRVGLGLA